MRNKIIIIGILILNFYTLFSQNVSDTLKPQDLLSMTLEDMLKIKIKVSSTMPTEVFNSPSTVSVIDKNYLEQYNFNSIAEAVQQVAGVDVLQTVIDKNVPTFRGILQNFYANKVLIMINNIPVWNPTYGNSTLDRININEVERIEVLKGPASVLYGTNAYTGVINIILYENLNDQVNARIDAGYPNLGSAAISYGKTTGHFSWNISGSSSLELRKPYLFKGGYDPDTNFIQKGNYLYASDTLYYYSEELRKKTFNAELNYKSHKLFFNNFINSYTNPGVNATYKTGANQTINDRGSLIAYSFGKSLNKKINLNISAYYDYHYRNQIMSQAVSSAARFSSYRLAGTVKLNYQFNEKLNFELGGELFDGHNIEHKIIAMAPDTTLRTNINNKTDLIEGSTFGQIYYKHNWLSIIGGLRYTYNNNFGGDISPRISALIELNKKNHFKIVYGESFRTPNLLELYFNHWSIAGNPNLLPEKSACIEISYLTHFDNFFGQINFYHSKYKNLIQRTKADSTINSDYIYDNSNQFEGFGLESEIKYQNPDLFNFFINYNYNTGNKNGIESNFKYTPDHTLSIGLHKPIKNFYVSINSFWYSSCHGPWEEIPSQLNLNAHIGYKNHIKSKIKTVHTLSFKNITKSDMLIPEYIRKKQNVNALASYGFGQQIIYTLKLNF